MTAEKNKLPSGWIQSSLGKMAQSMGGGTPSKADPDFWTDGTIPWVSPKDMKVFKLVSSEDKLTLKALDRLSLIPAESVLVVVRSGILSRTFPVAISKQPVTINQDMRAFVPKEGILADYLAWQLIAKEQEILSACSKDGTTVASIEGPVLANFPLLLAPAAEQTRIVEKLEELLSDLDAGVAELKAAQRKLGQYRQSLLKAAVEGALTASWRAQHTPTETGAQLLERILKERRARWEARQLAKFEEQGKAPPKDWRKKYTEPVRPDTEGLPDLPNNWAWGSLEQISEIQGGIQKQPSRTAVSNKYPFLRVANVARGLLKLDEVHEIELFEGELERLALAKGDVLIVEGNGSITEIGRCALWDGSIPNAVHQNHLIRARPIVLRSHFVEAWLNSLRGIELMTKLAATTSGLYTLSVGKLSKIPIPIPPIQEQQAIIDFLAAGLDEQARQQEAVRQSLKQSAAQRKNILKAAFSGQLVPQDPDDEPAAVLLERIRAERAAVAPAARRARPTKATA